jgi:hypothetical protein
MASAWQAMPRRVQDEVIKLLAMMLQHHVDAHAVESGVADD